MIPVFRKYTRAAWRVCFSSVWICFCISVRAQQGSEMFLKGPYLQGPGTDTMTIKWEAPTNTTGIVHYGLNGNTDRECRHEVPRALTVESVSFVTNVTASDQTNVTRTSNTNTVYLYEVTLLNLRPNSVYTYFTEIGSVRTVPKKFKTFAKDQPKVTFIAYGDARTNPKAHAAVTANFRRYSPDFILHTGDLVANGQRHDLWGREFFAPLANVLDEI